LEGSQAVFESIKEALLLQGQIGQRLVEAKSQPTAELLQAKMDELCRDLLAWLRGWVVLGKRAAIGEGCLLYWVERYWDELTPLHEQYDSFDRFAHEETGEEYSTYRQKMEIYRVFILNEPGDPTIEELKPRLLDVPVGKLQKAVARARRKQMDDEQWQALLDPGVGDAEFGRIISLSGEERDKAREEFLRGGGEPYTSIDMRTGNITYWRGALGVKIGYLDVRSRDMETREVVDRIIDAAGIKREL